MTTGERAKLARRILYEPISEYESRHEMLCIALARAERDAFEAGVDMTVDLASAAGVNTSFLIPSYNDWQKERDDE